MEDAVADGCGATAEDAVRRLQPPLGRPTPIRAVGEDTQGAAALSAQNPTVWSSAGPADPASVMRQRRPSLDLLDPSWQYRSEPSYWLVQLDYRGHQCFLRRPKRSQVLL